MNILGIEMIENPFDGCTLEDDLADCSLTDDEKKLRENVQDLLGFDPIRSLLNPHRRGHVRLLEQISQRAQRRQNDKYAFHLADLEAKFWQKRPDGQWRTPARVVSDTRRKRASIIRAIKYFVGNGFYDYEDGWVGQHEIVGRCKDGGINDRERLKKQLDDMVADGLLEKRNTPKRRGHQFRIKVPTT